MKHFYSFLIIAALSTSLVFSLNKPDSLPGNNASPKKTIAVADSLAKEQKLQEEILIVVRDRFGNEDYSKVIVVNEKSNIVQDASGRLAAGNYFVIGSSHKNRFFQQNIKVQ